MSWRSALWSLPVGLLFSSHVATVALVQGRSMQPTLNPDPASQTNPYSARQQDNESNRTLLSRLLKKLDFTSRSSDIVFVDKVSRRDFTYQRGDVVILKSPTNPDEELCKRIIAVSGDWVRVPPTAAKAVRRRMESIRSPPALSLPHDVHEPGHDEDDFDYFNEQPVLVGAGHVWVEGDNANASIDSRQFGPVPMALLKGRVTHVLWPPSRAGTIASRKVETRLMNVNAGAFASSVAPDADDETD